MEVRAYPRPKNDTGIGFHYYPDTHHYGKQELQRWLPELKDMGTSWLVVLSDPVSPIPEFFIRELAASEIEPIVRLYTLTVRPLDQGALARLLDRYANWGIHYVHAYNEPNLMVEWDPEEWSKPGLVDRFMDMLLPCLETMRMAGLYPMFTPLSSGGNYWDTAFLKAALDIVILKGKDHLFETMTVGMHNYAFNKPLTWGKGGQAHWPKAKPYHTPSDSEDHLDFYLFQWYDEIIRTRVGHSLPLISCENGAMIGDRQHERFPAVDEARHAQAHVEMSRMLMEGQLPDYVFNNAFWLLCNGEENPFEGQAWYKRDGRRLPAVEAMKGMLKHPRRFSGSDSPSLPRPDDQTKGLYHYLLFPQWKWGVSEWYWRLAIEYVKAFRPTCGFDPEDAKLAQFVTIIGDPRGVSEAVEEQLWAEGCHVERIAGSDAAETKQILDDLAKRGKRFLNSDGS